MIAKLKLGGTTLALFASLFFSAHLTPAQLPSETLETLLAAKTKYSPEKILEKEQAALVAHLADKYSQPVPMVKRIVRAAYLEADDVGVSPLLVLAIIEKESSLKVTASNPSGAQGLMQVVPRWHGDKLKQERHPEGLRHPETNIRVGSRILAEYLHLRGGNVDRALAKYSGGARQYAERVRAFRRSLETVRNEARAHALVMAANEGYGRSTPS